MLADTDRLERILYEIMSDNYIQDNNIKVSVKTRIGIESPDEWYNILEVYNKFSLEELIIHPRVRTDYYRGDVNKEASGWQLKKAATLYVTMVTYLLEMIILHFLKIMLIQMKIANHHCHTA